MADLAALEEPWRDLEQRADASPFQTWTWLGCLGAERFPRPVLLEARVGGRIVALALGNRARFGGTIHLGETGTPLWDGLFVEHNGPLLARGHEALLPRLLAALAAPRLVLSGVADAVLAAAPPPRRVRRSRPAPFVDLAALPPGAYAASLGRATRAALARSRRAYAERGTLRVERAHDVAEGLGFLDRLIALHQATWTGREKPGAFAAPAIVRFHRALVARGLPRGEVELLRCTAGADVIGYLYNLRAGGRVCNYQGGFDYAGAGAHGRPGLTCHELTIEAYRAEGCTVYDFLAGEDRYKRNLAHTATTLHWAEVARPGSLAGLLLGAREASAAWRERRALSARAGSARPPPAPGSPG